MAPRRQTKAQLQAALELSESERSFQEAATYLALEEGIDPADLHLALEDKGWVRLGDVKDGEQSMVSRRYNIIKARLYAILDPNAVLALRTWTNYTLGSGMTIKATDPAVQSKVTTFLDNPKNRTITSAEGQRKLNRRLLTDGDLFLTIFEVNDNEAGADEYLIRKVDCLEVTQFIYDPEDSEVIWAYRRERSLPNGAREILYYRHWAYPNQDLNNVMVRDEAGGFAPRNLDDEIEENVMMYHMPFEAFHQRGNGLFTSALPWMTAMRHFLEDRIAITKGLAKYITKLTVKGGKGQITKIAAAMEVQKRAGHGTTATTSMATGGAPGNAVREAAKTFLQNENVSMDSMPRATGAGDALDDHKIIRLALCASLGMTEPYFGDAGEANLASATAMELPMLKQFTSHQKCWADVWKDICAIVCNFKKPTPVTVDVDYPPIVIDDVSKLTTAIVDLCAEFPELNQPEVLKLALTTLGLNNIDDIMTAVLAKQKANQEKADNVAKGLNPDGSKPALPAPGAAGGPQPVVLPPKPARQLGAPTGQKVSVQAAAEALAEALSAEVLGIGEDESEVSSV